MAVRNKGSRDTSSTLRGGFRKSTKLTSLFVRARENTQQKFTSLVHLLTVDFLRECFRELKKDKASGVDGVTVKEYGENLEENLKDLVERLKAKRYRPQPVRRVYTPKPKIYHMTYTLSSKRGCLTEEPCAGELHAGFCEGH